MRTSRLYLKNSLVVGQTLELSKPQSHYLNNVLRLKPDDSLVLFNGDGCEYSATIKAFDKHRVIICINAASEVSVESPLCIKLGQGISRGERMDWVLQKSVELGVNEITPLFNQRSNVKIPEDRREKRLKHWQGVVSSACEQCGRNVVPVLNEPGQVFDWLQQVDAELKLVLHHRAALKFSQLNTTNTKAKSVALFIGSEGGLTEEEIAMAEQCGFQSVQLGRRVLRTETAALAAISSLQTLFGDL